MNQVLPIVIANSVPKSGTYLIQSVLSALPGFRDARHHLLDKQCFFTNEDEFYRRVDKTDYRELLKHAQPGDVFPAHLQSNALNREFFEAEKPRIKQLFIYRHPLDIWVSNTLFCTHSETMQRDYYSADLQRYYLEAFSDDSQRLLAMIYSNPSVNYYLQYQRWLEQATVLPVKFEDLYLALEGSGDSTVLGRIYRFIGVDPAAFPYEMLWQSIQGEGLTVSREKQKTGQYRRHFEQKHWNRVLDTDVCEILKVFDYGLLDWELDISLFGAGSGGLKALHNGFQKGQVKKIYDNDPVKWGSLLDGIPVCSPDEIDGNSKEHFVVCSIHREAIASQLFSKGVPSEQIHIWRGIDRY